MIEFGSSSTDIVTPPETYQSCAIAGVEAAPAPNAAVKRRAYFLPLRIYTSDLPSHRLRCSTENNGYRPIVLCGSWLS